MKYRFNVRKLIADCGGPRKVADLLEICRTTPYRWQRTGTIPVQALTDLLTTHHHDFNHYVELTKNERRSRRST